jgi:hypothetical protein
MTLAPLGVRALEEGEPVRAAPWQLEQWLGFAVYAVLLVGLVVLAWRLARPDPETPQG